MPVSHSISIHALRGEGDPHTGCCLPTSPQISIHALRGEGDEVDKRAYHKNKAFQSTPSVGRATPAPRYRAATGIHISIHALRGEGDNTREYFNRLHNNFNPRPPWGGRRLPDKEKEPATEISIHALRGEGDGLKSSFESGSNISIHALRGEGDWRLS